MRQLVNGASMKWTLAAISWVLVLGTGIYLENCIWIGQECESTSKGSVCDKKPVGSRRPYYFSLDMCVASQRHLGQPFICASGPNSNTPDATAYSSYRRVYFSGTSELIAREVPLSFRTAPILGGIIVIMTMIGSLLTWRKGEGSGEREY
jgi:hypothetical protein